MVISKESFLGFLGGSFFVGLSAGSGDVGYLILGLPMIVISLAMYIHRV